ncbi:hypothetical protein D320_21371 [Haloferax sp. BAB-2207]|uniref:Uncharacterized protein n=2 Tax=Haloferax TaxID=2251 RepID=M0GCR1_HALL2|nr:hypothetical protein D320_21371 [Haloferax sp. BAB-2207]ELZ70051.1 hypothetical protein C456_18186 [Haloferax lucentense DSM 14919]
MVVSAVSRETAARLSASLMSRSRRAAHIGILVVERAGHATDASDERLTGVHNFGRVRWGMQRKGALVVGYTICVGGLLLTARSGVAVAFGVALVTLAVSAVVLGGGV